MQNNTKTFLSIILRYTILLLVAIPNLWIFYLIFTPITIYLVYHLFEIFFDVILLEKTIMFENSCISIELINACIAGSAYYLLLMLNLATPKIRLLKRINLIILSFLAFLILNILRIFSLGILLWNDSALFDITHKILWYSVSILFVVGIWMAGVKLFKINETPFYSDIKYLFHKSELDES